MEILKLNNIVRIKTKILEGKCILIKNANISDKKLELFIKSIGNPIYEDRNVKSGIIYNVQVQKPDELYSSYANTNYYFPLHTDCFSFTNPPNGVVLLCKYNSAKGGKSLLLSIDELIPKLSQNMLNFLQEKKWYNGKTYQSILKKTRTDYKIYYNRTHIELSNKFNTKEIEMLDNFDILVDKLKIEFKLKPNHMILFRNDKFLHGRTNFNTNSKRLLKRIRFNVMPSD